MLAFVVLAAVVLALPPQEVRVSLESRDGVVGARLEVSRDAGGFAPLVGEGGHRGDVFVDVLADGTLEVTVANGCLENPVGTLVGRLSVRVDGEALLRAAPIRLADGTARVVRSGPLPWAPRPGFGAWYTRGRPVGPLPPSLAGLELQAGPIPDRPKTSETGSVRVLLDRWPLAVAMILRGPRPHDLEELARWVDDQHRRPALFYHEDGRLFRAVEHGRTVIAQHGISDLWDARVFFGRARERYGASESDWWAFDHGHFEVDRLLVIHALTGSESARRAAESVLEAAMTFPGFRPGDPDVLGYADAQRHYGWMLRGLALAHYVLGRDDYRRSIRTVVESLERARDESNGPRRGEWWWLCLNAPKTDSMHPEGAGELGTQLDGAVAALGESERPLLEDLAVWRQVRLWQHAVLCHGLGLALEVNAAPPRAKALHVAALEALVESARALAINVETGRVERPDGLWRCYAPRFGGARPIQDGGRAWVYEWYIPALMQGARMYPDDAQPLLEVARIAFARARPLLKPGHELGSMFEAARLSVPENGTVRSSR